MPSMPVSSMRPMKGEMSCRLGFHFDRTPCKVTRMTADSPAPRTVPVLVPMPAERAYSYLVPADFTVVPGSIVRVPLGPRQVAGIVWDGSTDEVDPVKLRPITE